LSGPRILIGDCLEVLRGLPDGMAQTCVTSPPYYGLRDYGHVGQIGLEETPDAYVARLVEVFREVRRVLRDDGTLWLNLGDTYNAYNGNMGPSQSISGNINDAVPALPSGSGLTVKDCKPKDLLGIPWMVAFALRADGWWLRQDIIWHKPNPMPESVTDRCTKAHEYVFLLTKSARYFYDAAAISEPMIYAGVTGMDASGYKDAKAFAGKHAKADKQRGHSRRHAGFNDRWDAMTKARQCSGMRNARSVWPIATRPYSGAHFATMPPDLAERCIKAGSKPGDMVLDPFGGAGTTGLVADRLGRSATLIELNPEYARLARERITADAPLLVGAA
jgi:DNA modification methylase